MQIIEVACFEIQGARSTMQDVTLVDVHSPGVLTLGIFDGHFEYGDKAADLAQIQVADTAGLTAHLSLDERARVVSRSIIDLSQSHFNGTIESNGGTTASIACVELDKTIAVSTGDSQIYYFPQDKNPVRLTVPHDGTNDHEMTRVSSLGYSVNYDRFGRVQFDGLYLTRALGDYEYDFVIPNPDISKPYVFDTPGFLLGGTDGSFGFGSRFLPIIREVIRNKNSDTITDIASELATITSRLTGDNSSLFIGRVQ